MRFSTIVPSEHDYDHDTTSGRGSSVESKKFPSAAAAVTRFERPCAASARCGVGPDTVCIDKEYTKPVLQSIVPSAFEVGQEVGGSNCVI